MKRTEYREPGFTIEQTRIARCLQDGARAFAKHKNQPPPKRFHQMDVSYRLILLCAVMYLLERYDVTPKAKAKKSKRS